MTFDGYWISIVSGELAGWFVLMLGVVIAGTLAIRITARRLEHHLIDDVVRQVAIRGSAYVSIDRPMSADQVARLKLQLLNALEVHPKIYRDPLASLRPFVVWLMAAFIAGVLATLLAQRLALSAEFTTAPWKPGVVDSAVVARSAAAAIPATEDSGGPVAAVPASEAEAPGPPGALITQPRDDTGVLGRDRAVQR